MLGLGMGMGNSDLRLQKLRELRAQEAEAHDTRKPTLRVVTGSVPAKGSFTTRKRRQLSDLED